MKKLAFEIFTRAWKLMFGAGVYRYLTNIAWKNGLEFLVYWCELILWNVSFCLTNSSVTNIDYCFDPFDFHLFSFQSQPVCFPVLTTSFILYLHQTLNTIGRERPMAFSTSIFLSHSDWWNIVDISNLGEYDCILFTFLPQSSRNRWKDCFNEFRCQKVVSILTFV